MVRRRDLNEKDMNKEVNKEEEEEEKIEVFDKRRIKTPDDVCDEEGEPDLDRTPLFVDRMKDEMEKKDARLREYIAAHKEKMAEIDLLRKRLEADVENRAETRFGDLIKNLFPIIDDFDRAIEHAKKENPDDPMLAGIVMLRDGFFKVLIDAGLEITDFAGKPFDPEKAQAVSTEVVDDEALDDIVIEQLAPGYLFNEKVLRPAIVRVGQKA